jgi:hypothetical protein
VREREEKGYERGRECVRERVCEREDEIDSGM